jgi:hypothetical protein
MKELITTLEGLEAKPAVKVVILTHTGKVCEIQEAMIDRSP